MRGIASTVLLLCLCRASSAYGVLKVSSEPPGAMVSLDGKRIGRTPCTVGVPVGRHTVTASARRYESDSRVVEIKEGEETSVCLMLLPVPIDIKVKCDVKGAAVHVDGTRVGLVNETVKARPGVRELAVVKEGYRDYVRNVRIPWKTSGKKPKTYPVKLTPGTSFRSGSLMDPQGWSLLRNWRFAGGVLVYDSGDKGRARCRIEDRAKTFAALCRYRATNIGYRWISVSGCLCDHFKIDGKWHTLVLEADGREGVWKHDKRTVSKRTVPVDKPLEVEFYVSPPANNDPFRLEISTLVVKKFESAAEMEAAVRP